MKRRYSLEVRFNPGTVQLGTIVRRTALAALLTVHFASPLEAEERDSAVEDQALLELAAQVQHLEILARLSELHRQTAAEVESLNEQRAALMNELAILKSRREAEAAALAELTARRHAEAQRLESVRQAIAMEVQRFAVMKREQSGTSTSPPNESAAPQSGSATASMSKRVFVHYSTRNKRGRALAEQVAERLVRSGYDVLEIRPVDVPISLTNVRYFFPDDAAATSNISSIIAASLREHGEARASTRVQNFTRSPTKPPRGTLEVWLPGE